MPPSSGQRLALEQLLDIERASRGALSLRGEPTPLSESGNLTLEIAVRCRDLQRSQGGLPLRDRERFELEIPADFPFERPLLRTPHTRFAGFEHVQWGRHLCLYQSPETEWDPSDGMFGFIARLDHWLTRGALNQFETVGEPLHPPTVYADVAKAGIIVPRVDTPHPANGPWLGLAHLDQVHALRADVVGWTSLFETPDASVALSPAGAPRPAALVVLLTQSLPFEYPAKVSDLISQLAERGVSQRLLLLALLSAARQNEKGAPLYALVGTPMRGISRGERAQHLAAWRMDPWVADALRIMEAQFSDRAELREIGDKAEAMLLDWASSAPIAWASVREARPEVTIRRDIETPAATAFQGKTVSVWGCGALGGYIAEYLARAGARKLILRDGGVVAPGILVRQAFEDRDIGRSKARATADRVLRIDPRIEVVAHPENLLAHPLGEDNWTDGADVIIDASASEAVLEKLELCRATSAAAPVPVISLSVDHRAERGLVAVARADHSGGPRDVIRRAKLETCRRAELRPFADAFWPRERRHPIFQPEPGCSANTFIGSAADMAGLAAAMLNFAAADLVRDHASRSSAESATAHLITQSHADVAESVPRQISFAWHADVVSVDLAAGFQVRIARGAWAEMEAWVARACRTLGPTVETGGVLFGERNDACRVIWISEILGPPPDSSSAPEGFVCGVEGVASANEEKRQRTGESVGFVGMWHTHPTAAPLPSTTDLLGMAKITAAADSKSPKALLLIIGRTTGLAPSIGTFVFSRREFDDMRASAESTERGVTVGGLIVESSESHHPPLIGARICTVRPARTPLPKKNVALALSGGGSRAIAFHLGCLRALHDRGVLEQVTVLSTVSGGSVIGALFAYCDGDFASFEDRVERLLRRGLMGSLARKALLSPHLVQSLATTATAGLAAVGADVMRSAVRLLHRAIGRESLALSNRTNRIQPPLRRWSSRSTAFEATLREELFGDRMLTDRRRGGVEVILNATELRTGTAFRFGSSSSGCTRFGSVTDSDTTVALAVAASAAYPALLPALDRVLQFRRSDGTEAAERVLLADGGIYDNLGTMCLEPGRSDLVSLHVFRPDYIIACDAGVGVVRGTSYPSWWATRMSASFEAVFRRAQNSTRERLHRHVASGAIKGFVFPYLGQRDRSLPWRPTDLVPREAVENYPTDFSPMKRENVRLLAGRGEQLTRLLLAHYCPEL